MNEDKILLEKLSVGELRAFDSLYIKYSARVMEFALRLTKSREEAEDITHNVFLKIWEGRELISKADSFKNYLFRMVKNEIFNTFKKSNLKFRIEQLPSYFKTEELSNIIDVNDLNMLISLAIEKMPLERKQIFKMSRYEELSYKEIADKLEISPKTVQYHISKALSDLRKVVVSVSIFI